MSELERGLPSSMDAERSILGAILLDNACMSQVEAITAAHFSLDSHRRIFAVMNEMHADGIPIDFVTLKDLLHSRQLLEAVGGIAYLTGLIDCLPHRVNLTHYVKIVSDKARLRQIIHMANKAISRAEQQMDSPDAILSDLDKTSLEISADTVVREQEIFLNVSQFIRQYHEEVQWRVHGVIEMGTNGIMVALPKGGKSVSSVGLAVSLASGTPWLDFHVRRARTCLVTREDYAGTTARRIRRYIAGMGILEEDLDLQNWLFVSSRAQLKSLLLDNPADLRMLINNLKRKKTEFLILDVLNVLHSKDENDNSEMRQVLRCVDHIRNEVGCQVLVIHHSKKGWDEGMTLSECARGSTAIGGFAEFLIGIRLVDEENQVRQMKFETKAGEPMHPIYWQIKDLDSERMRLERTEWNKPSQRRGMAV